MNAEEPLGRLIAVDQLAPEAVARGANLSKSELNETALAGEHLDRQLPAVFGGHRTL